MNITIGELDNIRLNGKQRCVVHFNVRDDSNDVTSVSKIILSGHYDYNDTDELEEIISSRLEVQDENL